MSSSSGMASIWTAAGATCRTCGSSGRARDTTGRPGGRPAPSGDDSATSEKSARSLWPGNYKGTGCKTGGFVRICLQISEWVHGRAVHPDLEVNVRAEAVPGAPDVTDHLSLRDGPAAHREARLVSVRGREPAAVVDDDEVPVPAHPAGVDDGSGSGRVNGRAVTGRDVNPLVHPAPAHPEAAHDGSGDRPDETARRNRAVDRARVGRRGRGGLRRVDAGCELRADLQELLGASLVVLRRLVGLREARPLCLTRLRQPLA